MMKHEFEKLVGRQIPVEVYMEIENEYMESKDEKQSFSEKWTAEELDTLIIRKFFDMSMKVLESESKVNGYQKTISDLNKRLGSIQTNFWNEQEENNGLYEKIEGMAEEIKELKVRLYDKLRGVA